MTVAKPRYQFKILDVHAAIGKRLRAIGRRAAASFLLVAISIFGFLASGYFLTYTLFFTEMPLSGISVEASGGPEENFRYTGVSHFRGVRLSDGDLVEYRYVVPRFVARKEAKEVEFFVRLENYADGVAAGTGSPGRLVVSQGDHISTHVIELEPVGLQRHRVAWQPLWGLRNQFEVRFEAAAGATTEAERSVVYATNLRNVTFWPQTLAWLAAAVLALGLAIWLRPTIRIATLAAVGAPLFLLSYIHSGAFISNLLFGVPLRMRGMGTALLELASSGQFSPTMYRGTGIIFVPLVTALIEGRFDRFVLTQPDFVSIFPTWRYVLFAWTAASLAVLLIALNRYHGSAVAFTTGIFTALFIPYITDLYYPESDAYLIPLMLMAAGLFIALCHRPRAPVPWALVLGVGAVLMAMMSVKMQAFVLLPILPLALYAHSVLTHRTWRDRTALAMFVVALVAVLAGNQLRTGFYDPERHVGIEGVGFQSHNFWSQLYWGLERYDRGGSAHGPESGANRRVVMEEILGLEGANYPHHSQRAQDEVYRPGVINALRERPGQFYSNFFLRGYLDAVRFLRYSQGRGFLHEAGLNEWRQLIRYSEFWKIAPMSVLIQSVQNDLPKAMDVGLLVLALIGIALVGRTDVMIFLYGCVGASFAHAILFHGLTRYFNFMNFALLIGLAVFVVVLVGMLRQAGNGREAH